MKNIMYNEIFITVWCQLAFKSNLSEQESLLLDKCAKRILELIDTNSKTIVRT